LYRNGDRECGFHSHFGFHGDAATMGLNRPLAVGQSEAQTFPLRRMEGIEKASFIVERLRGV